MWRATAWKSTATHLHRSPPSMMSLPDLQTLLWPPRRWSWLVRRQLSKHSNGILEMKTGQIQAIRHDIKIYKMYIFFSHSRLWKSRSPEWTRSKETIRVKTAELGKHRHLTSKGAVVQLQEEIKACSSADHNLLLSELHMGGFKVEVPVHQILGMKADLTFPGPSLGKSEGKTL